MLNDPSRARAALLLSWRSLLVLVYVACLLPMALLCLPMTLITRSVAHLKVATPPSFLLLLIPNLPHPPPLPRPASPLSPCVLPEHRPEVACAQARQAVKSSSVKIYGRDVSATWKLLVAVILAPALWLLYTAAAASLAAMQLRRPWTVEVCCLEGGYLLLVRKGLH